MKRRAFLSRLLGAAAAAAVAPTELLLPSTKKYFLPPRDGWVPTPDSMWSVFDSMEEGEMFSWLRGYPRNPWEVLIPPAEGNLLWTTGACAAEFSVRPGDSLTVAHYLTKPLYEAMEDGYVSVSVQYRMGGDSWADAPAVKSVRRDSGHVEWVFPPVDREATLRDVRLVARDTRKPACGSFNGGGDGPTELAGSGEGVRTRPRG